MSDQFRREQVALINAQQAAAQSEFERLRTSRGLKAPETMAAHDAWQRLLDRERAEDPAWQRLREVF